MTSWRPCWWRCVCVTVTPWPLSWPEDTRAVTREEIEEKGLRGAWEGW